MAKTRAFGSSSNNMSSRTDSSFWNEQARATRPGNSSSTSFTTRWAGHVSTSAGSCRLATEQHLLQRVASQAEAQCLERDHLVRRDVAEVDVGPEMPDEPGLALLGGRLPDQGVERNRVLDLVDEPGAQLAARPIDAGRAPLAALGDDAPRARVELLLHPLDPEVRRDVHLGVLRADLREHGEVAREVGDELELALARDLDRAVGDLDVRESVLGQPALELLELVACVDRLEERPAAHDRRLEVAIERDLLLEVVRDVAGAPAELDDVDVGARGIEEPLDLAQVEALVDDVREPGAPRLAGPLGQSQESVFKARHRRNDT